MYLAPDDAKTDVILAAATAVLGVTLRGFVTTLPFYPRPGLAATLLDLAWVVVLTALVPVLLARHRRDGAAGFGFTGASVATSLRDGLLLAVPAAVIGLGGPLLIGSTPGDALLGRIAARSPVTACFDLICGVGWVVLAAGGVLILYGFLAVRARDGFPRSPDVPLARLMRVVGLGAVGVAGVAGVMRALVQWSWVAFLLVLLNVLGLAAILLLVDRLVPVGPSVPRAAIAAPLIVLVIAKVFAAGGLFRGDLLGALYTAGLGAGVVLTLAVLAQTRRGVAVAIPLVLVVHWLPTCYSPLTLASGLC
ncbi:MAG: hypothetical protein ACLFRD_08900 [Nitriliruptoraceae bacterium]